MKVEFSNVAYMPCNCPKPKPFSKVYFGSDEVQPENGINVSSDVQVKNDKKPGVKDGVGNVWKFFAKFNQMAVSIFKGVLYGGLTALAFLTGSYLFKTLPNGFKKEGPKLLEVIKHPLKNTSKTGKAVAGVAGGLVFIGNLISGILASNQKTAVIDHKLKTGHRS